MPELPILAELKTKSLLLGMLSLMCVFAPGLSALWLFSPEAVKGLDTIKLLILSSAITLPLVLVNTQVARGLNDIADAGEKLEASLLAGLAITALLFGGALFVWFLLEWDSRSFGATVVVLELALCGCAPIIKRRRKQVAERKVGLESLIIS